MTPRAPQETLAVRGRGAARCGAVRCGAAARRTATGEHLLALGAFESLMVGVTRQPRSRGTRSTSFVPREARGCAQEAILGSALSRVSLVSHLAPYRSARPFSRSIDHDTSVSTMNASAL